MIDQKLLAILVCPATKQKLRMGTIEQVKQLNKQISRRQMQTVGGTLVRQQIEGVLIRDDGLVAYGIVDGIPNMLVEEAIVIAEG